MVQQVKKGASHIRRAGPSAWCRGERGATGQGR